MESIKLAVARVAAGLASGEMKEEVAVMVLESVVSDHTRDKANPNYVLQKFAESILRWNKGEPGSAV